MNFDQEVEDWNCGIGWIVKLQDKVLLLFGETALVLADGVFEQVVHVAQASSPRFATRAWDLSF